MGGSASVAKGSGKPKDADSRVSPSPDKKSEKKTDPKSAKKEEVKPPINYFSYKNVYFNDDERKEVLSHLGEEDLRSFNQIIKVATSWMIALQEEYSRVDPDNEDGVLKFACMGEGHEELMTPKKAGSTKYLTCISMLMNAFSYFNSNDFSWKMRQCLKSQLGDLFTEHELYPILINCLRCIEKMPWVKLDRRLGTKAADYKLYWPLKNTLGLLNHYVFYVREAETDHIDELVQFCYNLMRTHEDDYRTKKTMEDEERVLRNGMDILSQMTFTSSIQDLLRSSEFISSTKAYASDKAPGIKVAAINLLVAALQDAELGRVVVELKAVECFIVGLQQIQKARSGRGGEDAALFYGWDAVALVDGLKKIAVNTNVENVVQRLGVAIEPLKKILTDVGSGVSDNRRGYDSDEAHQEGNADDEKDRLTLAALDTLAMLSYNEMLCDKLRENSFSLKLKGFAKHPKQEVRAVSRGLLEKLGSEIIPQKGKTTMPSGHVMISYCHANTSRVWPVKSAIEHFNFKVWIDQQTLGDSVLDMIPDAIEKAAVVVIFVSEQYKQSFCCRKEAEYAMRLKKHIVYVKVDSEFKSSKSLGYMMGEEGFDVTGKRPFDAEMQKIKKRLDEMVVASKSSKPVSKDDHADPRADDWREKHNLKSAKYKTLQIGELKFLKSVNQRAPEFFFRYLETRLKLQTWSEIAEFESALKDPII